MRELTEQAQSAMTSYKLFQVRRYTKHAAANTATQVTLLRAKKKERESSISSRRSLDCKTEAKTIQFLLMLYGQSCHPKPLQGQKETFSMYWMAELYSIESRGLEGRQPIRISVDYTAAM